MGNRFADPGLAETGYAQRTLARPGCRIRYWRSTASSGPWLLFLHGAGVDHRMFNAQLPAIPPRFRVLVWDARGHGLSRPMDGAYGFRTVVDDLGAIMDAESIRTATLIGQSAGGNIAQEMAFRHPERVDALVIIDSTYNLQLLSARDAFLVRNAAAFMRMLPWRWMTRQSARASAVTAEARAYVEEAFSIIGKEDFIRVFGALGDCIHFEGGRSIGTPILLVIGGRDGTGNIRAIANRWPAWEPRCRLAMLPDAGHMSNMDAPEEFNRLLSGFLGEHHGS
jgi:pimeloyl-ACP methyl ester carboxylesterase